MRNLNLLLGFVLGLVVSAGGYVAAQIIGPVEQEMLLNGQSIIRDGGIGYQDSFAPQNHGLQMQPAHRNPC